MLRINSHLINQISWTTKTLLIQSSIWSYFLESWKRKTAKKSMVKTRISSCLFRWSLTRVTSRSYTLLKSSLKIWLSASTNSVGLNFARYKYIPGRSMSTKCRNKTKLEEFRGNTVKVIREEEVRMGQPTQRWLKHSQQGSTNTAKNIWYCQNSSSSTKCSTQRRNLRALTRMNDIWGESR